MTFSFNVRGVPSSVPKETLRVLSILTRTKAIIYFKGVMDFLVPGLWIYL